MKLVRGDTGYKYTREQFLLSGNQNIHSLILMWVIEYNILRSLCIEIWWITRPLSEECHRTELDVDSTFTFVSIRVLKRIHVMVKMKGYTRNILSNLYHLLITWNIKDVMNRLTTRHISHCLCLIKNMIQTATHLEIMPRHLSQMKPILDIASPAMGYCQKSCNGTKSAH